MRSVQQDNGGDSKLLKNIAQEKVHQSFSKWPLGVHRKCVECKSVPNRRHWWGGVVNLFKKLTTPPYQYGRLILCTDLKFSSFTISMMEFTNYIRVSCEKVKGSLTADHKL